MVEDELVVRARIERSAFAALYDRYYPRIMKYCMRRLFVREVAEDVTSDVFLQIAGRMPSFAGTTESEFRRWLFRIASNAITAYIRQTRRREDLLKTAVTAQRFSSFNCVPSLDHLDWPTVFQAILELEPKDQTILSLRFYADLPHDEIADIVGMKSGAVRTALSRILDRLRGRFAGQSEVEELAKEQS